MEELVVYYQDYFDKLNKKLDDSKTFCSELQTEVDKHVDRELSMMEEIQRLNEENYSLKQGIQRNSLFSRFRCWRRSPLSIYIAKSLVVVLQSVSLTLFLPARFSIFDPKI